MKKMGFLLLCCCLQYGCTGVAQKKINGLSFVATREKATQAQVDEVVRMHANATAVMPFGFMRSTDDPEIVFNTDRQWFGETTEGARQYMDLLQNNGLHIMLKPQIWVWRGAFTGTIAMQTEEDWKKLEASYERFILAYAQLAQEQNVPLFCIGTELGQFVGSRPDYWSRLIAKIRAVYHGQLTYAANWDEYEEVPFWPLLDYVGIDAYFPLSDAKTPTLEQLKQGWQPWKENMAALSGAMDRPVIFTEFGYRSIDFTAKAPWKANRSDDLPNLSAQANAKTAIFEVFWNEKWFGGGYIWKWFPEHKASGGHTDNRFTPQNKPAENVVLKHYKAFGE
ncbi:glycoside hydrolase family 113 [Maribacter sp. 2307ULW6-5]|uniref:glycoside hydrolase family 113 n=1 Tax=Maribacter sp. 2307ULW6-5 TaxID=3386275 RepID=UPI0039BC311D